MEEYETKFLFRSIEGDDCCSDELRIIWSRNVLGGLYVHSTAECIANISSEDGRNDDGSEDGGYSESFLNSDNYDSEDGGYSESFFISVKIML